MNLELEPRCRQADICAGQCRDFFSGFCRFSNFIPRIFCSFHVISYCHSFISCHPSSHWWFGKIFGWPTLLYSCPIQGRVENEMRWSFCIEAQWIARMQVYHAYSTITGVDEIKWNEVNEMIVKKCCNEICGRGHWRNPEKKKPNQTPFSPPRNPHRVTQMLTWDPRDERRVTNRLCHKVSAHYRYRTIPLDGRLRGAHTIFFHGLRLRDIV